MCGLWSPHRALLSCSPGRREENAWQRVIASHVSLDKSAKQVFMGSGCHSLSSSMKHGALFSNATDAKP